VTEDRVVVKASVGLHARPAAAFVQEALKHKCKIQVESLGRKADGKSILQVLGLGVKANQEIIVRADGAGEAEAVAALVNLVKTTA
jgi:phosphocarrier protein